jgi:hypothetical protein
MWFESAVWLDCPIEWCCPIQWYKTVPEASKDALNILLVESRPWDEGLVDNFMAILYARIHGLEGFQLLSCFISERGTPPPPPPLLPALILPWRLRVATRQFVHANLHLMKEESLEHWKTVCEKMQSLLRFCFLCSKEGKNEYGHNVFRCSKKGFDFEQWAYSAWLLLSRYSQKGFWG